VVKVPRGAYVLLMFRIPGSRGNRCHEWLIQMAKTTKRALFVALTILAIAAAASPFAVRSVSLYWAKSKAHRLIDAFPPEFQASLNATPARIVLPSRMAGDQPLESGQQRSEKGELFTILYPPPQSTERQGKLLRLVYSQFAVTLLSPVSSVSLDAANKALFHKDWFDHWAEVYHTRPLDIDSLHNVQDVEHALKSLSEKPTRIAPSDGFAQFEQADRRGFIIAVDPHRHSVHAIVEFPITHAACGMYFSNASGVDSSDINAFLAALEIEPSSMPSPDQHIRSGAKTEDR
jgi:hypothetical protein